MSSTTKSEKAWFLVPFMSVWSAASLGGIYGPQIYSGVFDQHLSLFGIPFVAGALLIWPLALMSAFGRVAVAREGDTGFIFRSIGRVGWTRRFRWPDVEAVEEGNAPYGPRGGAPYKVVAIRLKSGKLLKAGSLLSDERRVFLISALNAELQRTRDE